MCWTLNLAKCTIYYNTLNISPSPGEGDCYQLKKGKHLQCLLMLTVSKMHNFDISKYLCFGPEKGVCSHGNSLHMVSKGWLARWRAIFFYHSALRRSQSSWGAFSKLSDCWKVLPVGPNPAFWGQVLGFLPILLSFLFLKTYSTNLELRLQDQKDYTYCWALAWLGLAKRGSIRKPSL